jgi:restriction system protein
MTVPDYQSLMLPLLKFCADKNEHSISEAFDKLVDLLKLSDQDRKELLPSGKQSKFENRVHWAKTFLLKAGLLEAVGRARFKLTKRGETVLSENPPALNDKYLLRYPEYAEFRKRSHRTVTVGTEEIQENLKTPLEVLEESYLHLKQSLAQELLETIKGCSPRFFEKLVVDMLVSMGYGGSRIDAGSAIGKTGDGGIDGIIKEDKLGLDIIYIQAKRWSQTVGAPEVQAFAGSLEGFRARKGVMLTTSKFSPKAYEYIEKIEKRISLIDGEQLAQLMIDNGVGVTEVDRYIVKRIDKDYFENEV